MKKKKSFVGDIPRRKFLELSLKGGLVIAATPPLITHLASCKGSMEGASALDLDPGLLQKVIKKAVEMGGDFAEVYIENRIRRNILM